MADLRVIATDGTSTIIPLRAGSHIAEWAYDRPDVRGRVKHRQPDEIAFRRPDRFLLDGTPYQLYLYYSEHDLPDLMEVSRVEIRYVNARGGIELERCDHPPSIEARLAVPVRPLVDPLVRAGVEHTKVEPSRQDLPA